MVDKLNLETVRYGSEDLGKDTFPNKLKFFITLDNNRVHGYLPFSVEERTLFQNGAGEVQTSKGVYRKIGDISRVMDAEEARDCTHFSKWEGPRPIPARFFEYCLISS